MTPLFARAISTLTEPFRGIHLIWNGPGGFLFAPGGWQIERRPAGDLTSQTPPTCDEVFSARLALLRNRLELRTALGWVRLTQGIWPGPEPGSCEVFTLDMDVTVSGVSGRYRGRHGLAVGLHNGKVVGFQFVLFATDGRDFDFGQSPIDQVIVYGLRADAVKWCVSPGLRWRDGELIAKLQVPLGEFSPDLDSPAKEFAEATSRLLAGESIDQSHYTDLADILRVSLNGPARRPMDNFLRIMTQTGEPEDMHALDPLRLLLASPKWRRVMGLSFVDKDSSLTVGDKYDYKITGLFPASEINKRIFGFHTLAPGTVLPDYFMLHDCRFRFPNPVTVRAAPGIPATGEIWTTRLGVPLEPRNTLPWTGLGIDEFSVSMVFPAPVEQLILELDAGHNLKFAAGIAGGPMMPVSPVPAGGRPQLDFPTPITQLNLTGEGFLFSVRITDDDSDALIPVSTILPAVEFRETPLPDEPAKVGIKNLQTPSGPAFTSNLNTTPDLHLPGFNVRWAPAPAQGIFAWPADLAASAPLDATMFNVERRIEPAGNFTPVLPDDDNLMFGTRSEAVTERRILPGKNLMSLYPEIGHSSRGSNDFSFTDTFQAPTDADPTHREPPPPGTFLRYRVRTVDAIGRSSENWRESESVRLEKHEPPPLPAAFDPMPADELTEPGFTGVYAKVLVSGSAELTDEETTLLGTSDNVIVLRWGWHDAQRNHDPHATEFRVYLTDTFDSLPAEILSANKISAKPGDVMLELSVPASIRANAAAGLSLSAGYPFFIVEHTGGTQINMLVRTRIPDDAGAFRVPELGPVRISLKLSPQMTQPMTWNERFVFPSGQSRLAITPETQYQAVFRDRLLLSAEHPRDSIWVGVSSADSEPYVDDKFPQPGPDGPLAGNESPVVAVRCEAKRVFRPEFDVPPPAGPVPRVLTPEPTDDIPVEYLLDLAPHITAAGLLPGELVQPERVAVTELFGTLSMSGGQLVADAGDARDTEQPAVPLSLSNPGDQALLLTAVQQGDSEALEDRLAVHIAAIHPYAGTLFRPATASPVAFATFKQVLPADESRYLYRVRRADSQARVSVQAAVANVVVRVPSLQPGAQARLAPPEENDPATRLRLHVPDDSRLTHLLVFEHLSSPGRQAPVELLRLGNRPELGPDKTVRLRHQDGTVIQPSLHPLNQAVQTEQGWMIAIDVPGPDGEAVNVWASTLTVDGIPSAPAGPWKVFMPKAALQAPALAVTAANGKLDFNWTLPDPQITHSWLEVSSEGSIWKRASSMRKHPDASASIPRPAGTRHFRAVAACQDGRRSHSNRIEV